MTGPEYTAYVLTFLGTVAAGFAVAIPALILWEQWMARRLEKERNERERLHPAE